jgi:Sensors of blue-light using FAD
MHHIIYLSTAAQPMTDEGLALLLAQCRRNNERLNITGALIYGDGQFMQIMEGEQSVVRDLYQRLESDPRHTGLMKLADKDIPHRSFGTWRMAFEQVGPEVLSALAGYTTPAEMVRTLPGSQSAADALLFSMLKAVGETTPS